MSPATRGAVRMVLSAVQAGVITAGAVLLASPTFDQRTLIIAAISFCVAFAKNVEAYLAELPPLPPG